MEIGRTFLPSLLGWPYDFLEKIGGAKSVIGTTHRPLLPVPQQCLPGGLNFMLSQDFWHFLTAQKVRAAGSAFYRLFLEIRLLSRAGSSVDWVEMSNRNFKLTHTFLASSTIIHVEGACPEKNCRALGSVSAAVLLHDSSLAFLWKPDDLFFFFFFCSSAH